jgi:hypothetical protein
MLRNLCFIRALSISVRILKMVEIRNIWLAPLATPSCGRIQRTRHIRPSHLVEALVKGTMCYLSQGQNCRSGVANASHVATGGT